MKYLRQFCIIITVSFIGEVLKYFIPLPIPACIYGLIIMLFLLCTKILPVENVEATGTFLVEIMPIMFVPASVGLMESWFAIKPILWKIIAMTILSTIIVMIAAGWTTQIIIRLQKRKKHKE